jgi:serine/threonine protein kinase
VASDPSRPAAPGLFTAIGVDRSDDPGRPSPPRVAESVGTVSAAFTELGYSRVLPGLSGGASRAEAMSALEGLRADGCDLVVYWNGHGRVEAGHHYLATTGMPSTHLNESNALSAAAIGRVLAHTGARRVLLLLDCRAGGVATTQALAGFAEVVDAGTFPAGAEPLMACVASSRGWSLTPDDRFADAVADVARTNAGGSLRFSDLMRGLEARLGSGRIDAAKSGQGDFAMVGRTAASPFQVGLTTIDLEPTPPPDASAAQRTTAAPTVWTPQPDTAGVAPTWPPVIAAAPSVQSAPPSSASSFAAVSPPPRFAPTPSVPAPRSRQILTPPACDPLAAGDPTDIGRFRLLGRLGAGGMGLVYLGEAAAHVGVAAIPNPYVAVKVIHADVAAEPEYRRRFAREVAAASRVVGRFTAPVVDADPGAAQPWFAAEYVAGPTVAKVVRRSGPLAEPALRALAAGLADALAAIEAAGLVHRDLKPDNILLAADGPKVIDFGIARTDADSLLTRAGALVGSPGYMSPEQVGGERAETPSDVFSLGAVLAFAAQGVGPFGDGPIQTRLYLTRYGDPDLSGVPQSMSPLIARCLARDPGDRPTPRELVAVWSIRQDELDTLNNAPSRPEIEDPADNSPWQPPPIFEPPVFDPLDSRLPTAMSPDVAGAQPRPFEEQARRDPARSQQRSPFEARDWTISPGQAALPPPPRERRNRTGGSDPWWHQPLAIDRLPGGPVRDVTSVVMGCVMLSAFSLPGPNAVAGGTAKALLVAEQAVALFLGLTAGVRRGVLAVGLYSGLALVGWKILPDRLPATFHDSTFGLLLGFLLLAAMAAAGARLGGIGKRPILGFVIAFAAYIAAQGVAVEWNAHVVHASFLTVWRNEEHVGIIYRDALIAAAGSVGVAFLLTWLLTRRVRTSSTPPPQSALPLSSPPR